MNQYTGILKKYEKFRRLRNKYNLLLAKGIPKSTLIGCAKALNMLGSKNVILFGSEEESAILMDYAYHYHPTGGKSIVEKYMENQDTISDPDESEFRSSLLKADFAILQVQETIPNVGGIVLDWNHQEFLFIDIGLSVTAVSGLSMVTRVISPGGIHMTTGMGIPLQNVDLLTSIANKIEKVFRKSPQQEMRLLSTPLKTKIETDILRACVSFNATSGVRYQDPVKLK